MKGLHYSIDRIQIKNDAVFTFGWIFDEVLKIDSVFLTLKRSGESFHIPIQYGNFRQDVKLAFWRTPHSGSSGFLGLGSFPGGISELDDVFLTIHHQHFTQEVLISGLSPRTGPTNFHFNKFRIVLSKGFRVFTLVKKNGLKRLATKFYEKYFKGPRLAGYKQEIPFADKNVVFFVDHSLGGGANKYNEIKQDEILAAGGSVVVLTFFINELDYILRFINNESENIIRITDLDALYDILEQFTIVEAIYNNLVSIPKPIKILKLLNHLKNLGAKFTVYIHDFYPICPSHFLLNHQNHYCDIPATSHCDSCLNKNANGFISFNESGSITGWRTLWGETLENASEIICFSNDSREKLLRVYPQINCILKVVPHRLDAVETNLCLIIRPTKLCIGVIGDIAYHKGAKFVQALAHEIIKRRLNINIKIIGRLFIDYPTEVIEETGTYTLEELPSIIETSGANVFLFPSICPETFSYTVQEIMSLELPVACFNIGAPPERVLKYSKGLVLASMDPSQVLDQLLSFFKQNYNE
jgi:glycosyltransferase involved in cell wall biosynthesis